MTGFYQRILCAGALVLSSVTLPAALAQDKARSDTAHATEPTVYVVNFTADWCPNCKVLDPALADALTLVVGLAIAPVTFDLTNAETTNAAFEKVNGTLLGGVYGDYIGLTGLVVMVAVDSGETISCATRVMDASGIAVTIRDAVKTAATSPPGKRPAPGFLCPPTNQKRRL
ncbi:MAG: thioredoxin domain-containing protein [Pseudomonadota bacterium]